MSQVAKLSFNEVQFDVVDKNGQAWLRGPQIADALCMRDRRGVNDIYQRHKDEFSREMTQAVKVSDLRPQFADKGPQFRSVRIFSLRGAHLIAMFAKTDLAKDFRKWVLDVLDQTQPLPPTQSEPIPVLDFSPLGKSITKKQLAKLNCAINALVNFRSMNNKPITQRELSCSLAREFGLQELQDLSRPRFNKAEEMVLRKIARESGLRFPEARSQKIVERQARCDFASGEILQIGHEALSKIRDRAEQALSFGYDCCRAADKRDSHILHHKRQVQCATELFMYTVSLIARSVDLAGEAETICD